MPKNSNGSTMARLWQLLKLLPSRPPGDTAQALHDRLAGEGHAVARRTVERDLDDLSRIFPIVCNDKGKPYGWYWMEGASLDIPSLTLAEALSLQMMQKLLRPLLPAAILRALEPHFGHAETKLEALAEDENPLARWKDKVRHVPPTLPLQPPTIPAEVLETVQEALLRDRQVEVEYQAAHADQASPLILHPLGLVQRGRSPTWLPPPSVTGMSASTSCIACSKPKQPTSLSGGRKTSIWTLTSREALSSSAEDPYNWRPG